MLDGSAPDAVAAPSTPELFLLQMVTPDLDSADTYRDILPGIDRTLNRLSRLARDQWTRECGRRRIGGLGAREWRTYEL